MHEFSVTQAAVEAALEQAEQAGFSTITDAYLRMGTISSIDPESIRMYWAEIAEGTAADRARLHFRRVPTECLCMDCRHSFLVEVDLRACPACGGSQVRAVDDEYLALEAIDIQREPVPG